MWLGASVHNHPIRLVREATGISKSRLYEIRKRGLGKRYQEEVILDAEVLSSHNDSKQRYGYRMVHRDLRRRGIRISPKRALRSMQSQGIRGKRGPRWKRPNVGLSTTKPQDLIGHKFQISKPGVVYRDIKYIATRSGIVYGDFLKEACTKQILEWEVSYRRTKEVTTKTTQRFLKAGGLTVTVHHSDAGGEYVNDDLQQLLSDHKIKQSCGRGSGANNVIESFNGTLEVELLRGQTFKNIAAVRRALVEYIRWYNSVRLHSSLNYRTPDEAARDYHDPVV